MKLDSTKTAEYTMYFTMKRHEIEDIVDVLIAIQEESGEKNMRPYMEFRYYLESVLKK